MMYLKMQSIFIKTSPPVSYTEFINRVKKLSSFKSSNGREYKIKKLEGDVLCFVRINSKHPEKKWSFSLKNVYQAYVNLEDFRTVNFKKYIPIRHSPGRGLLISTDLIAPQRDQPRENRCAMKSSVC